MNVVVRRSKVDDKVYIILSLIQDDPICTNGFGGVGVVGPFILEGSN